ncbi:MAG: class I SAM-dependent methyltransferase [Xanthobacteraceae bacterium]|nr:class I SAM-dependent methyltransferase [Xanthobacteraceae bacterium]
MENWVSRLFELPALTKWGHGQSVEDANLGLGWIYYGLARLIRPTTAVVIGSYRGFAPLVLGKALTDNRNGGQVIFIDPSMIDDFWKDPGNVSAHFARFGVTNVKHFLMTTQQFAQTADYRSLSQLGLVFVDGYHSEEQARFDYETFQHLLSPDGVVLLHDTANCEVSRVYGHDRAYQRRVKVFVDQLQQDATLQVFDLPFDQGVTLVRKRSAGPE